MPRRCILKCKTSPGVKFHIFPSLERKPDQFKAWVQAVGGKLMTPEDYDYYRKQRICDRHFLNESKNRYNRVSALGVPSLYLSETGVEIEHEISFSDEIITPDQNTNIDINQPTCSNVMDKVIQETDDTIGTLSAENIIAAPKMVVTNNQYIGNVSVSDTALVDHDYCTTRNEPQSRVYRRVTLKEKNPLVLRKYNTYQKVIKQLRKKVKTLKKRGDNFKTRLENAERIVNKTALERIVKNMTLPAKIFTNMQFSTTSKKPSGRRFKLEEKVLSLSIYKRSPKCYALLSKYFSLPSPKTLKRLLSEIKLDTGINNIVFEKLKNTVNELTLEERLCTLIFDEMSITPQIQYEVTKDQLKGFTTQGYKIADHALVFMVKGVKKNFKQPVAYYFTNSLNKLELKTMITEVIQSIQKTGLIILCTICDQSPVNVSAINSLVEETKASYLRCNREWRYECFEINKQQIIPIYDVPHLIKGLRNNLLTKDMFYKDGDDQGKIKKIKWEYFQLLYEADKSYGELRCLQKLTEEHVNPEKIKKMRVKGATQLFSHSVAVATEHLTARGNLPQECRDLIPFVLLIDKLFDSLNGSTFHIPNGKVHKGPVKRFSPHHHLWQKAIGMLKTIRFVNKKNIDMPVPSVKNFIKTIEGMQAIWKILSQKYSFDCMLTRNFNQDPVENFFGNIRSFGARNVAPNCVAFEGTFKALLLNNYNSTQSIHANCEEDKNNCLQNLDFFVKEKYNLPTSSEEQHLIPLRENNFTNLNETYDAGQKTYVCGWVLTKCLKTVVKNCKACRNTLLGNKEDQRNSYIRAKEYEASKKWLCYPSYQLDKCFQDVQNITISHLKKDVMKINLKKTIKMFCDIFVTYPFECLEHKEKLKSFFEDHVINIIVYSWCRSINRILCGKITYRDSDDEVKVLAQSYYNKNRHKKENK